jgi:hypothetical protein
MSDVAQILVVVHSGVVTDVFYSGGDTVDIRVLDLDIPLEEREMLPSNFIALALRASLVLDKDYAIESEG